MGLPLNTAHWSTHGQTLREHCSMFTCCSSLQWRLSTYEMNDKVCESCTYPINYYLFFFCFSVVVYLTLLLIVTSELTVFVYWNNGPGNTSYTRWNLECDTWEWGYQGSPRVPSNCNSCPCPLPYLSPGPPLILTQVKLLIETERASTKQPISLMPLASPLTLWHIALLLLYYTADT